MQKIELVTNAGLLWYFNYANAALITILTMALFSGFYFLCRDHQPLWSIIAYSFVPVYGFGNLTAYLSQIFVIPALADLHTSAPRFSENAELLLLLLLQDWPGSAMAALNGLSYAVLGISSIIFALIMYRQAARLRIGSVLLALSGMLSIVAAFGLAAQVPALIFLLMISGVVYFLALIFLSGYFMSEKEK